MKNLSTLFFLLCITFGFKYLSAQNPFSFINSNTKFSSSTFRSGNSLSVADMDGDGMDDIARLNQGTDLFYTIQRTGQTFNNISAGASGIGTAWAMVVGDVNNDGVRDVAVGSGSNARVFRANSTLTTFTLSGNLPKPASFFPQNMNFADIDNDGKIDLFICNDIAVSVMYANSGTGTFPSMTNFFSAANPGSDGSGNYGSIWTDVDNDGDVDLYIAHCRQSTGGSDARRLDQLFINDGNNNYVLDATGARGLRNYQQTWTASFDDIDNDGDLDCLLTETDAPSKILLNDGNGYFTDITSGSGFTHTGMTPYQSKMADFDNDGFIDIMLSGTGARIYRNNGNNTFTLINGVFNSNNMLSFATGDLNHDGKVDMYSSYGGVYNSPSNSINDVLWLNTTENGNHFITFNLQGTVSNRDALGARVEIYGAWGKQIREVRAGESYGTTNTFSCHFGLGTATVVDSAIVRWPSGLITRLYNRPADQFIQVIEGQCTSPDNIVTFNGPAVLCTGQSVTMSAPAGNTYLWSTGDTTQTYSASSTGEFTVKITAPDGCSSVSKLITIVSQPDETPTISAAGPTTFCEGASVNLNGSFAAGGYLWSNGDTTQNIIATEPGTYSLTIRGTCADFTSQTITVSPISSHVLSVVNASACVEESISLPLEAFATGTTYWYESDSSNSPVNQGAAYTVAPLLGVTTYYVESHDTLFGISGYVGPADNTFGAGSNFASGNQYQIFDVLKPCTLKTVLVYSGAAGNRTIELRSSNGTVINSRVVNIPTGTHTITLDFALTPGTAYRLGWNGNASNLYRNSDGASYPYTIPNLVSITNSSAGTARWYAFYNWQVEEPFIPCVSIRVPVTATVYPVPSVTFTGLNVQYYESDSTVELVGSPTGGAFTGTGVSDNVFNPSEAGVGGPYSITYTYEDTNGCSATQSFDVNVLADTAVNVSVDEVSNTFEVIVLPNPNNGQFELRIKASNTLEFVTIQVKNAIGESVIERKMLAAINVYSEQIDLGEMPKGIYFLTIQAASEQKTFKVVTQ